MRRLRLREARERASDPNTGAEELAKLADHVNPAVRMAVARHANTSAETRRLLASDPIDGIRHALAPPEFPEHVTVSRNKPQTPPTSVISIPVEDLMDDDEVFATSIGFNDANPHSVCRIRRVIPEEARTHVEVEEPHVGGRVVCHRLYIPNGTTVSVIRVRGGGGRPTPLHRRSRTSVPGNGFCIRCRADKAADAAKPYCKRCYRSWNRYKNKNFKEKHCHLCGREYKATLAEPACRTCFKRYRDMVTFMTGAVSK